LKKFSIVPIAPLRPYVERLWGWESIGTEIVELPTLLSGTGAEMFFHYRMPFRQRLAGNDRALDEAHLVCVRRKPIVLNSQDNIGFLAVRFRAGQLHRFVDLPGRDLIDQTLSIAELWISGGRRLSLDVFNAPSKNCALEALQRFLVDRLERGRTDELVERATAMIYRSHATTSIQQLASQLDVTRRELERRFKKLTAQTPVEFRKLSRLQHVMRELLLDPSARVLDVVLSHGFYDQAHFIHEFSQFKLGAPLKHLAVARAKSHFYNTSLFPSANIPDGMLSMERNRDVLFACRNAGETVRSGRS
jgi:AraC-like DNA-binding protein